MHNPEEKKWMITCRESARLVNLQKEEKLTLPQRMKLMFHLSMCNRCRRFKRQSDIMEKFLHQHYSFPKAPVKLPEKTKLKIIRKLNQG